MFGKEKIKELGYKIDSLISQTRIYAAEIGELRAALAIRESPKDATIKAMKRDFDALAKKNRKMRAELIEKHEAVAFLESCRIAKKILESKETKSKLEKDVTMRDNSLNKMLAEMRQGAQQSRDNNLNKLLQDISDCMAI